MGYREVLCAEFSSLVSLCGELCAEFSSLVSECGELCAEFSSLVFRKRELCAESSSLVFKERELCAESSFSLREERDNSAQSGPGLPARVRRTIIDSFDQNCRYCLGAKLLELQGLGLPACYPIFHPFLGCRCSRY